MRALFSTLNFHKTFTPYFSKTSKTAFFTCLSSGDTARAPLTEWFLPFSGSSSSAILTSEVSFSMTHFLISGMPPT